MAYQQQLHDFITNVKLADVLQAFQEHLYDSWQLRRLMGTWVEAHVVDWDDSMIYIEVTEGHDDQPATTYDFELSIEAFTSETDIQEIILNIDELN
jgi:hypothetical protein